MIFKMYFEKIKQSSPSDGEWVERKLFRQTTIQILLRLNLAVSRPQNMNEVCTQRNDRAEKFSTEHLALPLCVFFLTGAAYR